MKNFSNSIRSPKKLVGLLELPSLEEFIRKINSDYFRMLKVDVLPPQYLYLSVLLCRIKGKFMFPLCIKYAEIGTSVCPHNKMQRMIRGVYTTPELKLAIKNGY